ncbi:MAG TPA: oligosaccharide flippase family protein [Luteibacter sp.]|uniref:oligosaccharide flippase family protein n=1 Tax=Luteibacter sp. TaxID=1886636 RepID=UPI002BFA3DAC|nr:oligosaccharide flippase family protein [Luteibacter sp.]HVI55389.1 oligosaccharide flippase family protein [Luteibacter sp.]
MSRRHIATNVIALYAVQGMQYVFPLMVLPIITRSIGPDRYGLLSFWQALAALLSLVVDYGFNYTSIRALNQTDSVECRSAIFWSTAWAKLVLLFPASIILVIASVSVPNEAPPFLVFAAWLSVLGAAISPAWFFIATRQNVAAAVISAGASLVSLLAMWLFVSIPSDFNRAALIQLGMPLVAAIALSMYRWAKLNAGTPRFDAKDVALRLREGFPLFVMTLGAGAYSSFNPFLLGLVSTSPQIADYALGERLVRAAKNTVQPILVAMYPYAAEGDRGSNTLRTNLRRAGVATLALSVVVSLVLAVLSPFAIWVVSGTAFVGAISTTRILSANVAVITAGHLIGVQYLVARGRERLVTIITVVAVPIHVVTFMVAGHRFGAVGGAIAYVGVECLVTIAFGVVAINLRKSN